MTNARPQTNTIVFACRSCGGTGADVKSPAECKTCKGRGHYVFFGGRFLYWGLPLSDAAIYSARLQRLLAILLKGLLIFVGVLGLISFLFELIVQVPHGLTFTGLFETQNMRMLVFWISVVVDMLILYYFDQELSRAGGIRVRPAKKLPPTGDHPTYQNIEKLHSKWKDDISSHFAADAIAAIEQSWFLARTWKQTEVQPIHLLHGLLSTEDVQMMLLRAGIARRTVEEKIKTILSQMETFEKKPTRLSLTVRALFFEAYTFAYTERKKKVGGRDLLRGLVRLPGDVHEVFEDLGLSVEKVDNIAAWITASDHLRREYREYRQKAVLKPKGIMNRALTARPTPLLDAVSTDWTLAARNSSFFPLVDRTQEMIELFRGLEQRGGNVLLIGEVGVGKRAIVRGLADRMVTEDVPEFLQDKRLVALHTSVLLSIVGKNVEAKLLQIVGEISAARNIVLFIEDIAELVGAGGSGSRTLDASGVLAQALTSQGVHIIASASTEEFAHHLQDNPSFLRHFHVIHVNEVETNVAIQVLEAQSLMIEAEHRVMFSYDAIESAVKLSDQYIHDAFLPEKAISIAEESAALAKEKRGSPVLVLKEDVQEIVSRRTNVRVTDVEHAEADVLLHLEDKIHERIVGQDEAVRVVSEAIRRARMKMRDENRPIVNLMFLGPTGVGKTELAKTVADVYFGAETNMIRIDMSEYQEKRSLDRLIGSAHEKGLLTEAVRNAPFSLVLFDELEKAHPDILNVFLQMMDDGRLTDGTGRTIDFTNAIIIATSNAGTGFIQDELRKGVAMEEIRERVVNEQLRDQFRPEFLNRFDSIVVFSPLSKEEIVAITKLEIQKAARRLEQKGIRLIASEEAITELAEQGYDPTLGARPIRRLIQDHLESSLARFLLSDSIGRRDIAILEPGGKIQVERAQKLG